MPSYRYRALTQNGEIVSGSITAPTTAEIAARMEFLGLILIETVAERSRGAGGFGDFSLFSRPKPEDVTIFTGDLALLLKTGARINDALGLLAGEADIGRLRPTVSKVTSAIMAGESFADALAHHPALFPPMYQALVRVGEASGTLDNILEVLAAERVRTEAVRRKLMDALRYPAFVLFAAGGVLVFFLTFVLPQFASVLRDFNAKLDPVVLGFLALSDFMRANFDMIALTALILLAGGWYLWRQEKPRAAVIDLLSRLPVVRHVLIYHRTALFCRNLGVLLSSGVAPTTTLRILADMMATMGRAAVWHKTVDHVRHGGKLSDALAQTEALPDMAVRTLRLGEETGQLPMLASRISDFYEAKLQRNLDRIVGIVGPLAIVTISIVVGGLIVSVMTALLSVSQVVG